MRFESGQQRVMRLGWERPGSPVERPVLTNRMSESFTYGSVGGAGGNPGPLPGSEQPPRFAVRESRASATRSGGLASRKLSRRGGCRSVLSMGCNVNITRRKSVGWFLIVAGGLVFAFNRQIVFPGLERLLGIGTIVGKENVVYFDDGGYAYTNPRAMLHWIWSVAWCGLALVGVGAWILFRARKPRGVASA